MIRESLNIVVVGHVDHGKSTLIGRLLYDTNSLPEGAIEKVKRISKEKGKEFEYAYLLDAFEEEQKQGITIDTTRLQFRTEKRDYVIIDAPGHKEFLKNMISGAASAEAALLMVDANEGIKEQSRRHGYILSLLGIKKVYVAVNKMDLVDYSKERFDSIEKEFNQFLNSLDVYPLKYIPISAYHGENIAKASDKMNWYTGETILECIDLIEKEKEDIDKPLRFPIQDVYKFDHRRIIAGRIESGSLKVGDEILISPSNKTTRVKTIEHWVEKDKKDLVYAGMSVGITVEDEFFNKRGEIISHKSSNPIIGDTFNANLFWMGKEPLLKNKKYKLKLATSEVECEILEIKRVVDASTLQTIENGESVNRNDVGEVIIKTKQEISFDKFHELQNTGRFVVVDGLDVSGGGIISSAIESEDINISSEIVIPVRERLVSKEEREERLKQKGKVIWLTGNPGCGKREIGIKLERKLFDLGLKVYYIDSTNLINFKDSILSLGEEAMSQTKYIAETAKLFADSGMITIVSCESPIKDQREVAREIIGKENYVEIFVDAPKDVCKKRVPLDVSDYDSILSLYEKSEDPVITVYVNSENFNSDKKVEGIIDIIF